MPLYEYQCQECGETHEVVRRFSDPPYTTCSSCGGPLKKLISAPAIQFKGSGFYITDYGKGGSKANESGAKSEGKGEGSSSASEGSAKSEGTASKSEGTSSKSEGTSSKGEGASSRREGTSAGTKA